MESKKVEILAIDDNPDNLISIKALISEAFPKYLVHTALSGAKGLEIAALEDPDVIILDIIMPEMNGFEFCHKLKSDPKMHDIPVIFVTAIKGDKDARITALEYGAEAFLAKPIDESELTAQIRAMVKIKAANISNRAEKERLAHLVKQQTIELRNINKHTLNLLEELKLENLEREKSEKALKISNEKYDELISRIPIGIYSLRNHSDGKIIFEFVSDRFCEIFGVHSKDVYSDSDFIYNLLHPDDRFSFFNERKLAMQEFSNFKWEGRLIIGGNTHWIRVESRTLHLSNGDSLWNGAITDITERKIAEEILQQNQFKFKALNDNMIEGTAFHEVLFDADGNAEDYRIITVNPAYEKLLEISSEMVVGKTSKEAYRVSEAPYLEMYAKVAKTGIPHFFETYFEPLNKYFAISVYQTQENGFATIFDNITNRKMVEVQNKKLTIAIEQNPASIVITDTNGTIEYVNKKFRELTGYSSADAIGLNPRVLKSGKTDPLIFVDLWRTITSGQTWSGELINKRKDGTEFVEIAIIAPIFDDNGLIINYVAIKEDITDSKIANEELRIGVEKLHKAEMALHSLEKEKEVNELKARFVATASHEFRNPLATILLTNESLINYWERLDRDQIKIKLDRIRSQVTHLASIVNDVLQVSKIQEGKQEIHKQDIDIILFFKDIISDFKESNSNQTIEFDCNTSNMHIQMDQRLIGQALKNLISNALKYSNDNNSVFVSIDKVDSKVVIKVKDSGIGIPLEDQKHLFEPFFRAKNCKMIPGNGLGLNITREMILLHGGDITFESKENVGTTFEFYLPIN